MIPLSIQVTVYIQVTIHPRALAEKFSGGGGQRKKYRKITKRSKNSTIKPLPEKRPKK